jgi:membrane protein implicated in regulation of membrane protease activity
LVSLDWHSRWYSREVDSSGQREYGLAHDYSYWFGALAAFIAGGIGTWTGWYAFWWIGFVVSIVVAVILVAIYARIKGKK